MYRVELSGCLSLLIMLALVYFLVKELWWFFVGIAIIIIISYYTRLIYLSLTNKQDGTENNFNPQMGEVFKVCPYCNTKVKVTETTCPCCKRALN